MFADFASVKSLVVAVFYICFAGEQLLLEDSDLCVVDIPKFVSMRTLTVSGQMSDESQHVYLTSQLSSHLHSTHVQPSIVSVLLNENINFVYTVYKKKLSRNCFCYILYKTWTILIKFGA